jgi:biotin transport system substrate-specific component
MQGNSSANPLTLGVFFGTMPLPATVTGDQTMSTTTIAKRTEEFSLRFVLAQLLWIAIFAGLMALAARVEIPHQPVPYTLQTMVVLLSGAFLGARNGAASQLAYLTAGAVGLPVFSGGAWGILPFLGPSGGYLLAFPLAAAVAGFLVGERPALLRTFLAFSAALAVVFTSGALYLYGRHLHDLGAAIASGLLIFSWWDMLKLGAATMIYREVGRRWPRLPMGR